MLTILVFVAILSILVLIHELGHFFTAKKFGIKVEEFGFGFPPKIFGKKIGETTYSLNLLPVGGFVKLYGEDEAGGGSLKMKSEKLRMKNIERAFFARPLWQRFTVVVAGVIMNFILAVVVISALFAVQGVAVPSDTVRIVDVAPNSPAQEAGLRAEDRVISINGVVIRDANVFISETRNNLGEEITLEIQRNGQTQRITVIPREEYPEGEGPIGVGITNIEVKKYTWYEAPIYGTWEALKFSWMILEGLGTMVTDLALRGQKPEGVAGPVGVAQLTGQAVDYGWAATLWFMALLSLNLAVLNFMPIPALDGGRLFFMYIEGITRKKVPQRYETLAHSVGLAILLALILLITFNDVLRISRGENLIPQP